MAKLSFNGKPVVVGIALSTMLLCIANHILDLRIFGDFDKEALVGSAVLMFVSTYFIAQVSNATSLF